jgi:hypothetical protein
MTGDEELNIINRIKEGDKELYSAIVDGLNGQNRG